MAVSLSTFSQTEEKINSFQPPAEPQEPAPTTVPEAQTPAQETAPTETPVAEQPTEQVEPVAEENVSSISLGFGDEQPTPEQPQPATTTPQTFNWKDEIKKVDKKELFKELGVHEFAAELNEYLQKGGKAQDYLAAKAIDYNQVSDEDIVKSDLRKQYPTFTPQQIELMFNRKYAVSEVAEDEEKEFVALQLKADAYNSRQLKIQEQQKFVIPDAPILQKDEAYEQWKQMQESQPAMMEKLRQFYENHDATKSLNESKRVAINLGEGIKPFNFSIERPEYLTKLYTDGGETWSKVTSTKTGEPDVPKQQLIGLFSFDPQKFMQDIFNYGMQIGKKKLVEEGQNAQRPQQIVTPAEMNGQASYGIGKWSDKARN